MHAEIDVFCSYQTDYYAHPENYKPIFHEKIAPFASVIGQYLSLCVHELSVIATVLLFSYYMSTARALAT